MFSLCVCVCARMCVLVRVCVCVWGGGGGAYSYDTFGDHSALTLKIGSPLDSNPQIPKYQQLNSPHTDTKMYGNLLLGELIAVAVNKIQCAKLVGSSL